MTSEQKGGRRLEGLGEEEEEIENNVLLQPLQPIKQLHIPPKGFTSSPPVVACHCY